MKRLESAHSPKPFLDLRLSRRAHPKRFWLFGLALDQNQGHRDESHGLSNGAGLEQGANSAEPLGAP